MKQINELTEIELKALIYDQIVVLKQTENNIKLLEKELSLKKGEVTNEKVKD